MSKRNESLVVRILKLANVECDPADRNAGDLNVDLLDLDDASMMVLREKMKAYGNHRLEDAELCPRLQTYIISLADITRKYKRIEIRFLQKIRLDQPMTGGDADFFLEQLTDLRNLSLITQAAILRLERRHERGEE